jgi:hypothetical protein
MSLVRFRPIIKNKEADMAVDVSGAWTSLTCYYTLHDKIVTLQAENERLRASSFVTAIPSKEYEKIKAENERLRKAGGAMATWINNGQYDPAGYPIVDAWQAAKGVQS